MGKLLLVASGKGGTGKTSFSSGVGSALAESGLKVLIIDADTGTRNMDIVLGLTDRALFSFADVCFERVHLMNAAVQNSQLKNLYLLTAPSACDMSALTPEQIGRLAESAKKNFDWVIVDCAAGFGSEISLFARFCDFSAVISTCDSISLRCAEKMASYLIDMCDTDKIKLVVNRVDRHIVGHFGKNIDDAIDLTGLPLLGIIPEDKNVPRSAELGRLLLARKKNSAALAYRNISLRVTGEYVPLSIR